MDYSVPSDLRVIDANNDGLADKIYVGDMGGQMWRFDIHNGEPTESLVTGGVIADLADDTEAGTRRFYYAPELAPITEGVSTGCPCRSAADGAHPYTRASMTAFYMLRISASPTSSTRRQDENGDIAYQPVEEDEPYDAMET